MSSHPVSTLGGSSSVNQPRKHIKLAAPWPEERYRAMHPWLYEESADIKVVSGDGTPFQIHSYYLQAHSDVFRHMIADFPAPSGWSSERNARNEGPILIPADGIVVARFLEMIKGTPNRKRLFSPHNYTELIRLCRMFEASTVFEIAKRDFIDQHTNTAQIAPHSTPNHSPWSLFILAAKFDAVEVARTALRSMDERQKWIITGDYPPATYLDVEPAYLTRLIKASLACREEMGRRSSGLVSWSSIDPKYQEAFSITADKFAPVVKAPRTDSLATSTNSSAQYMRAIQNTGRSNSSTPVNLVDDGW